MPVTSSAISFFVDVAETIFAHEVETGEPVAKKARK